MEISIDAFLNLLKTAGIVLINIYRSLTFEINGHLYDGFLVLVGFTIIFFLLNHIWWGDDGE